MFQLPPVPPWDGLHPLIIHFPIALLMVAPLFVVIGAVLGPRKGRPYIIAALLLIVAGTASMFVAIETGEAAAAIADHSRAIDSALARHDALAHRTRFWFSLLTVLFAAVVASETFGRWKSTRLTGTVLPLFFLLLYGAGTVLLANTAHQGGMLVHKFGLHAVLPPSPTSPHAAAVERGGSE